MNFNRVHGSLAPDKRTEAHSSGVNYVLFHDTQKDTLKGGPNSTIGIRQLKALGILQLTSLFAASCGLNRTEN